MEARKRSPGIAQEKAQRAQSSAERLINSMLFDLRDKQQPLGRIELLDDVSKEAGKYFEENSPET